MELVLPILLIVMIFGAGAYAVNASARRNVIAKAPPGAQINPDDNLATALAKSRNHHRVIEAVRIFNEIKHQDSVMPILEANTRADMDAFLADYYKNN